MNQSQLLAKRGDYKTSHVLHLILSILTGGLWLFVWVLVAMSNSRRNQWVYNSRGWLASYFGPH
jgi:hypothetical protein